MSEPGWVIEARKGVTEDTMLTLEQFCVWWRSHPPLFDDSPLWRRLYYDPDMEKAFRAVVVGKMADEALETLKHGDKAVKPCREWLQMLAALAIANGASQKVNNKIKDLSDGQRKEFNREFISPEWNRKKAPAEPKKPELALPGHLAALQKKRASQPARPTLMMPTAGSFVDLGRRPREAGRTARERMEAAAREAQS